MRNAYIKDTLMNLDIQKMVKIGGKLIQIYDGVIYQKNFTKSPFTKVIEKQFASRDKYNDKGND